MSTSGQTPSERLDLARRLADDGQFDAALVEYLWVWRNIPTLEPSMAGVRLSFVAADIKALVRKWNPARVEFAKIRSGLASALKATPNDPEALADWLVLNRILGDPTATLKWFEAVVQTPEMQPAAVRVESHVSELLMRRGLWRQMGILYPDPIGYLKSMRVVFPEDPSRVPWIPKSRAEHYAQVNYRAFKDTAGKLYCVLVASNRIDEARQLILETERLDSSVPLLTDLIAFAMKSGIDQEHVTWLIDRQPSHQVAARKFIESLNGRLGTKK